MIRLSNYSDIRSKLPSTNVLLNRTNVKATIQKYSIGEKEALEFAREVLNSMRTSLAHCQEEKINKDFLLEKCEVEVNLLISNLCSQQLKTIINATGVILHTNLGRSPLADKAIEQVIEVASNYTNIEYSLESGVRDSRHALVEHLIVRITGAEAAMVVNNNAAAVYLILNELCFNREVVISRDQLVEIGGSFRVSEIMKRSGANLVEIGTTNKTYIRDYENSISTETAMLMHVHKSNFTIEGFVDYASIDEIVSLGKKTGILTYQDLGSGVLYDIRKHGIGNEPTIQECIKKGIDLVSFSGDKLFGGPQAGIIVGNRTLINRLKKNQLSRIIRIDKLSLAALEATLKLYLSPTQIVTDIPILRMLLEDPEDIRCRAQGALTKVVNGTNEENGVFNDSLQHFSVNGFQIMLEEDLSTVGGGCLPGVKLPTWVLSISVDKHINNIESFFRKNGIPPIVARINQGKLILDFRTVLPIQVSQVADNILKLIHRH